MSHVELYEGRQDVRFLKTGCSNGISGDKNMFYELNEGVRKVVKLANKTLTGFRKCEMYIMPFYSSCVITEIYYVPDLMNNL
jgi:hypothetical protein